jgi:hypothetical protein
MPSSGLSSGFWFGDIPKFLATELSGPTPQSKKRQYKETHEPTRGIRIASHPSVWVADTKVHLFSLSSFSAALNITRCSLAYTIRSF